MATCARCGGRIEEGDAFCRTCGATAGGAAGGQTVGAWGTATTSGEEAVWPDGSPALDPFEPLEGRARWAKLLLGLSGLLAFVSVFLFFERANALDTFIETGDFRDWERSDDHFAIIGLPQTAVGIATIVLFLVWFHRAYKNLPALGARRLRWTAGWSIGAWFVPFLNLVRPKAIANDIWKASDPELPAETAMWRERPVAALVHWWWGIYLLSIISITFTFNDTSLPDQDDVTAARVAGVRSAVGVVAAILAILLVSRITERQRERAERAGAA
jgi:hypothetical protein